MTWCDYPKYNKWCTGNEETLEVQVYGQRSMRYTPELYWLKIR
jgi:hypothetical protein